MINTTVKFDKKGLNRVIAGLQKLDKSSLEYGIFADAGVHYSGMTFAELLAVHEQQDETNVNSKIPKRDPLYQSSKSAEKITARETARSIKYFILQSVTGTPDTDKVYKDLGAKLVTEAKSYFGDPKKLLSNSPNTIKQNPAYGGAYVDKPLVDFGQLRSKVTFKVLKGV